MSDFLKNPMIVGGGSAVVGLFIGILLSNASMDRRISDGLENALTALEQRQQAEGAKVNSAMSERITSLETLIGNSRTELAGFTEDLGQRIEAGTTALTSRIGEAADGHTSALKSAFERMEALAVSAVSEPKADPAPVAKDEPELADTSETAAISASSQGATKTLVVGETAVFLKGKIRAFVSRFDADAQSVWFSINGKETPVVAGQAAMVTYDSGACHIGVASVSADGVEVSSDCDTPLSGPSFRAGQTAVLADGALRVFVSGVLNGEARLAVNGFTQKTVSLGGSEKLAVGEQSCTVSVTGIREGAVSLAGDCS